MIGTRIVYLFFCFKFYQNTLEPVGAKAPSISSDDKSRVITRPSTQNLAILCQLQGFPVPSFRLVRLLFFFRLRSTYVTFKIIFESNPTI